MLSVQQCEKKKLILFKVTQLKPLQFIFKILWS